MWYIGLWSVSAHVLFCDNCRHYAAYVSIPSYSNTTAQVSGSMQLWTSDL